MLLLVQPHYDYRCVSWFHLLNKNVEHKLKTGQNKYIRLCLISPPRSHVGAAHFRKINWLPVSERVEYCIAATIFKS